MPTDISEKGLETLIMRHMTGTPHPPHSAPRESRNIGNSPRRALALCLFINGLPISTFELKTSLTKQTVEEAIGQSRRDRDPREKLFEFGRCMVHFAVDDAE